MAKTRVSKPPFLITEAQDSLTIDQGNRQRRYLIMMSIRTTCFLATIFLPSPYRWATLVAAMILPYIAVVLANAGRETITEKPFILKKVRPVIGLKQ